MRLLSSVATDFDFTRLFTCQFHTNPIYGNTTLKLSLLLPILFVKTTVRPYNTENKHSTGI